MAFNERKAEGSDGFVFTNVADSGHQWANDNLGVVLEEVNLQNTIGEVQDDSTSCPEPCPEVR